jgi:hypothetical protein
MPFRMRRSVAIVGIALAIFAAFNPAVALALPLPLATADWLIAPPDAAQPRTSETPVRAQRRPLLEPSLGRAPPLVPFLA